MDHNAKVFRPSSTWGNPVAMQRIGRTALLSWLALAACSADGDVAPDDALPAATDALIPATPAGSPSETAEEVTTQSNLDPNAPPADNSPAQAGNGNETVQAEETASADLELSEGQQDDSAGSPAAEDQAANDSAIADDGETVSEDPPEPAPPQVASPTQSPGCASGSAPTGALSVSLNGVNTPYVVTLPNNYDPSIPAALVFGFHGRGRTHVEFQTVDASGVQTEVGTQAIMVYVKSHNVGNGWNFEEEVAPNVEVFDELFPRVMQDYCVDPSRVFAIGHSSGGYFANILACRYPDRFRGIGSVAGATQECSSPVAALIVHGVRDEVVSFQSGQASRDGYLAANNCSSTSSPTTVSPCIAYDGCAQERPVQWCEHNEPTYENTNHGWPSFASRALGEFLFAL